jgi:hypothetical protein
VRKLILLFNPFCVSSLVLRPTQPPVQWVTCLFPGGKAVEAYVEHTTSNSAAVKQREKLYLKLPFWAFVACYRVSLNFTFICLPQEEEW